MDALQTLVLLQNKLKTFPDVSGCKDTLKTLNVASNKITEISENALDGFKNLTKLNLSSNQLKRIPDITLMDTNISTLSIKDNELVCDCNLAWIINASSFGIDVELNTKPCREPQNLVGTEWSTIEVGDLVCPGKHVLISEVHLINIQPLNNYMTDQ